MTRHAHHTSTSGGDTSTHRGIVHLELALRDVDLDDLRVYLKGLDDPLRLREYVEGLASVRYERGETWAN